MPKLDLGPLGVGVNPIGGDVFLGAVAELEELGYSTIWLLGGQLTSLEPITDAVGGTREIRVATGIISVDRFEREAVAATYAEIEASRPGRFVVGLGGAHGASPFETLTHYLDELDSVTPTVPATARVLAALGPRMLEVARDRAAGAIPVLVTPEYTVQARARLGDDRVLAIQQLVVLESDPERARQIARGPLGMLSRVPGYAANFRRMGFADDEIEHLSDRLVDALVAWGDVDAVAARIAEHRAAGADHINLSLVTGAAPEFLPVPQWRRLAEALAP